MINYMGTFDDAEVGIATAAYQKQQGVDVMLPTVAYASNQGIVCGELYLCYWSG